MSMQAHPDLEIFEQLYPAVRKLQALAQKHGINDIFQDNGGKLLQVLLLTGLEVLPVGNGRNRVGSARHDDFRNHVFVVQAYR